MRLTSVRAGSFELPLERRPAIPAGPYVVAGVGRAGMAAVEALRRRAGSTDLIAVDRQTAIPRRVRRRLEALGVETYLGPHSERVEFGLAPRTLIKSPGIAFENPMIALAQHSDMVVLDELELGWRLNRAPVLAVTGTNGKTTVATLAAAVLSASNHTVRLAGNTQFGPPLSALDPGVEWIVCEVSSFQLEGCPAFLPDIALFTNLTRDHLARHRTMWRYAELKRRMFIRGDRTAAIAIIDVADAFGRVLAEDVENRGGRVIRVGFDNSADYVIERASWDLRSSRLKLCTPGGALLLETQLPGLHNARNVALAVALGDLFEVESTDLVETIAAQPPPPARLECLELGQRHDLILDCAASPAAVEACMRSVRAGMHPDGRLHTVLGVVGSPDPAHLHALGYAAGSLSDKLSLTAGSLRPNNPPLHTIEALAAGARDGSRATVQIVPRRRDAMRCALLTAAPCDVVIVLGRGDLTEPVSERRLDDRIVLRELTATCGFR